MRIQALGSNLNLGLSQARVRVACIRQIMCIRVAIVTDCSAAHWLSGCACVGRALVAGQITTAARDTLTIAKQGHWLCYTHPGGSLAEHHDRVLKSQAVQCPVPYPSHG